MTEDTFYAQNQVRQCHITLDELEISQRKIILYTRHLRKELNATKCRIQHQREKWHCGNDHHSSIDQSIAGITGDLVMSAEQCRSLAKGKMIYLADKFLGVTYDTKNLIVITDGSTSGTNRSHCDGHGWSIRDTFPSFAMNDTKSQKVNKKKVSADSAQVLPSALEELGCGTTSLDPYGYIWDYPDNCALSVLRTENVNMMKQGTKSYNIRGPNLTTKIVFEVKNNPQEQCGKQTNIYPTNCDSFNAAIISESIDLRSGRNFCQGTEWCRTNVTV